VYTIICNQEMCCIRRVYVTKLGAVVKGICYYIKNSGNKSLFIIVFELCNGNLVVQFI
jgi:hypothetical protein